MRHRVLSVRPFVFVLSSLAVLAACDPPEELVSPEKAAMERACALDVRGEVALVSVGGPAVGTITLAGADGAPTSVDVTITRDALFAAEAPFLAQVPEDERLAPLVFSGAQNRFTGAGTTGNTHSEVTGSFSREAAPGPGGSSATLLFGIQLVFQNRTDTVTGALQLTFKETRPNVVTDGDTEHQEGRSFALRGNLPAELDQPRTAECQAAIDAYNAAQSAGPM